MEIGVKQGMEFVGKLTANLPWHLLRREDLQYFVDDPKRAGEMFFEFIKNRGKPTAGLQRIDELPEFPIGGFFKKGAELEGHDERSLQIERISLKEMSFIDPSLNGEMLEPREAFHRFMEQESQQMVPLDARFFWFFHENRHLIPDAWKDNWKDPYAEEESPNILFSGSVFLLEDRDEELVYRVVLGMRWNHEQQSWGFYYYEIDCSSEPIHCLFAAI